VPIEIFLQVNHKHAYRQNQKHDIHQMAQFLFQIGLEDRPNIFPVIPGQHLTDRSFLVSINAKQVLEYKVQYKTYPANKSLLQWVHRVLLGSHIKTFFENLGHVRIRNPALQKIGNE
jgi:hypothetical protein